jgi:cyclase
MFPRRLGTCILSLAATTAACGQRDRKVTQLASGVYEIQHATVGGVEESGNTTVIIGDRQVLVVDACFLPSAARGDIALIRQWTSKPVAFVLNTHFHNDHNLGNRVYMDEFPAVTIIAHAETKREMDLFGPSSARRSEGEGAFAKQALETGKGSDGKPLSAADRKELTEDLAHFNSMMDEIRRIKFQSATLWFEQGFSIDLGNREVQIKFLGRGNTGGDAVVYLPKEKIVATGDLVVYPIPYMYDGYPSEWAETLNRLGQLDVTTIVPGHGPVLHDKAQVYLVRDVIQSAVDQMTEKLRQTGPAMFQSLDNVKGGVDLTPFKQKFIGGDTSLTPAFDEMAASLVKITFEEATLR